MSVVNVPVQCDCGWTGWRRPEKIKARPCPACDGKVTRNKTLEIVGATVDRLKAERLVDPTPLERAIADTHAPVPRLPNPYILRAMTGEVQVFRIPPRMVRRSQRKRRRS